MAKSFAPYVLVDEAKVRFFVLLEREQSYALLKQEQSLRSVEELLNRPYSVWGVVFNLCHVKDARRR